MEKRKEKNFYKTEISTSRFTKIFIKFLLVIIFYSSISSTEEKVLEVRLLENSSIIKMIINSDNDAKKKILGEGFSYSGYKVSINDNNIERNDQNEYDLSKGNNTIILSFREEIDSCAHMFDSVKDILEIDLSEFDSSKVENMSCMFKDCNKLYFKYQH